MFLRKAHLSVSKSPLMNIELLTVYVDNLLCVLFIVFSVRGYRVFVVFTLDV